MKTLIFILFIKMSVGISYGFVGDDLGIDLYKNIDSSHTELEQKSFSYEIAGQFHKGEIKDELNIQLTGRGLNCQFNDYISEDDLLTISQGDIEFLYGKLSNECFSGDSLALSEVNELSNIVQDFVADKKEIAKKKADAIYRIARMGLYTDGSTENSPFDLMDDIRKIDTIAFTQTIKYEAGELLDDRGFGDYLRGKYQETEEELENSLNGNSDPINELTAVSNIPNELNTQEEDETIVGGEAVDPVYSPSLSIDQTHYACPTNDSGLSSEDLANLASNINDAGIQEYAPGGEEIGGNEGDFNSLDAFTGSTADKETQYTVLNDNSIWPCSSTFCVDVDFIIHDFEILGGGKMRSIESILQASNKHLKEAAGSSLIQSKMTINNFESLFRDLDFTKIFNMGFVISKKSPPIINLDKYQESDDQSSTNISDLSKKEENKNFSRRDLHCKRLEAIGLNCKRENDLSIFIKRDEEQKHIYNSEEMSLADVAQNQDIRSVLQDKQKKVGDFLQAAIKHNSETIEGEDFYTQLVELEKFIGLTSKYSHQVHDLVLKMKKIPIHP